jgi:4-amino-4-deoxy-L-arabinose transferase-like glycosyltransferase
MKSKTLKDLFLLTFATCLITFLVWLPHLLRVNFYGLNFSEGFNTIYRNFDGIEYIIIGKTFYNERAIASLPQELPHTYYAAHFPFYSLLILVFEPLIGQLKSMLFVSVLSTIASVIAFYFLVRDFKLSGQPLFLSLVFLVLPARWLIAHSVGSSEPTFIFFTIAAIYYFLRYEQKKDYLDIGIAGVFGLLAQLTRPPGILLFIALGLFVLWKSYSKNTGLFIKNIFKAVPSYFPLILIPLGLLSIFILYQFVYNDFFAYFHSGDNIHLSFPPFQIFNINQYWVGSIWLEDVVYVYILGLLAGIMLLKKDDTKPMGLYVLTYVAASLFIAHRDISRYVLPVFPFALIAFEKVLTSKEFKIVLAIVLLGIYLYSQNFLLQNTAPFPNPQWFD